MRATARAAEQTERITETKQDKQQLGAQQRPATGGPPRDGWTGGHDAARIFQEQAEKILGGLSNGFFPKLQPLQHPTPIALNPARVRGTGERHPTAARNFNLGGGTTNSISGTPKVTPKVPLEVPLEVPPKPGPLIVCFKMWKR